MCCKWSQYACHDDYHDMSADRFSFSWSRIFCNSSSNDSFSVTGDGGGLAAYDCWANELPSVYG